MTNVLPNIYTLIYTLYLVPKIKNYDEQNYIQMAH